MYLNRKRRLTVLSNQKVCIRTCDSKTIYSFIQSNGLQESVIQRQIKGVSNQTVCKKVILIQLKSLSSQTDCKNVQLKNNLRALSNQTDCKKVWFIQHHEYSRYIIIILMPGRFVTNTDQLHSCHQKSC